MYLTIDDIDRHAALLTYGRDGLIDMGTGNAFWRAMCQFVSTFSENDQERRTWFEFLETWRDETAQID